MKKVLLLSLTALIFLGVSVSAAYAADRIGFIDSQRILAAHPKSAESERYLDDFHRRNADEAEEAARGETDPARRMAIVQEARSESEQEEWRIMSPLLADINRVIEMVAQARGVTVVVERAYVFFGGVDLTEDIIREVSGLRF